MEQLRNKNGITLVELIIVLAIVGIVLIIGYNLFYSGLNHFGRQADNINNQANARQVLREISQELRRAETIEIVEIDDENSKIIVDSITYEIQKSKNALLKNGKTLVTDIKSFKPEKNNSNNEIKLSITTLAKEGHEITLSSSIYIRE